MPVLQRTGSALFIVVDCLRLDQWKRWSPLITPLFDVETTHYFSCCRRPRRTRRNALFSGLFPGEIAARFPDWWGEREDESLNAHERELLEAQLAKLGRDDAGALREDLDGERGGRARAPPARVHRAGRASRRSSSTSSTC